MGNDQFLALQKELFYEKSLETSCWHMCYYPIQDDIPKIDVLFLSDLLPILLKNLTILPKGN